MPRPPKRLATPFGQCLVDAVIRAGHGDITSWGESLGIAASAVSDFRSGRRNPPGKALEKWAKSLKLSGNELLRFYIFAAAERAPRQIQDALRAVPDMLKTLESEVQSTQRLLLESERLRIENDRMIEALHSRLKALE